MSLIVIIFASFLTFFFSFLLYLFYKTVQTEKYYKSHNVPYLGMGVTGLFGFLRGKSSMVQMEEHFYKTATSRPNSSIVAFLDFAIKPNLYVTDLDLIKAIFVKDFDHFVDRRPIQTQHISSYMQKSVPFSSGDQWRGIRTKLSPIFTTGKIKRMFQIFKSSSERMDKYLKIQMNHPSKSSMDFDLMQIFSKYTMDVIASCAFGIDSKSFDVKPDQKSVFEKMGDQFGFKFTAKFLVKVIITLAVPKVADFFGFDFFDWESQEYFSKVIKDVMKRRRQTGEKQDDFLQLMMELQQGMVKADEESNAIMNGDVAGDEDGKTSPSRMSSGPQGAKLEFDDDHIIANGMLFLSAGFDPTQSALLFTLYALALEQEVQKKLYKEVKSIMDKNGGELTYDGINEMKYLDLVLNESNRRYTPSTRTERSCTRNYTVPGTKFVIEKGSVIVIPIHGIHQDERHFPNPKSFIPERFTPENKASRHPYAFLPFGHGPRNCIGNRFALVKVKAAIAQLVYSYQFAPCTKTKIPLEFDSNPNVKPKNSMWLNITARN